MTKPSARIGKRFTSLLLATVLSSYCAIVAAQSTPSESLVTARTEVGYQLSVPISRLVMTIPDAKLEQQAKSSGSMNGPRYFYLSDEGRGLILSGWFEPAQFFKGLENFWTAEMVAWRKQGLSAPINVEMLSVGGWQVVCYDMQIPDGTNTHVRAHWVQAGTWIDLHISLTGKASDGVSRQAVLNMLKKVGVVERSDS